MFDKNRNQYDQYIVDREALAFRVAAIIYSRFQVQDKGNPAWTWNQGGLQAGDTV